MSEFGGRSQSNLTELINLNAKAIAFERREKLNGSYVVTAAFDFIKGRLTGYQVKDYEYKGKAKHKVVFELESETGAKALVGVNFGNVLISILNSLCVPMVDAKKPSKFLKTANKPNPFGRVVTIGVYAKDVDGESFCQPYVYLDGDKTDWGFTPELMAILRKKLKDGDDQSLINFMDLHLKPEFDEWNLTRPSDEPAETPFHGYKEDASDDTETEDDDLPF